jgi:hypothetical protein
MVRCCLGVAGPFASALLKLEEHGRTILAYSQNSMKVPLCQAMQPSGKGVEIDSKQLGELANMLGSKIYWMVSIVSGDTNQALYETGDLLPLGKFRLSSVVEI